MGKQFLANASASAQTVMDREERARPSGEMQMRTRHARGFGHRRDARRRGWRATITGLALAVLAVGCAGGADNREAAADEPLLVMAASSLNAAMPALIERFEAQSGDSVVLVLGATGNLAAQIENGAPADVFFAADEATVERLAASGSLRPGSARTFVVGELALVWRAGVERPASPASLAEPRYEVIAIANPEIAPYGMAAREALQRLGIWDSVSPRIVQGENIAQTYQFVQTGNADAALVARSVVDTTTTGYIPVDAGLHEPIRQAAGILARSTHPAAEPFLEFVLSDEGQMILRNHGFLPAPR